MTLSRKAKRGYGRIMSGLNRALANGYKILRRPTEYFKDREKHIYFLTLTTKYDKTGLFVDKRLVARSFQKLVKRIRRKYSKFEYIRIRTVEGGGVLHVLFFGCYLDINWVREAWKELHFDSRQIKVIPCYGFLSRIARYLVKYMVQQDTHLSFSDGWLWKGFCRDMKVHFSKYRGDYAKAILLWIWICLNRKFYKVTDLNGSVIKSVKIGKYEYPANV